MEAPHLSHLSHGEENLSYITSPTISTWFLCFFLACILDCCVDFLLCSCMSIVLLLFWSFSFHFVTHGFALALTHCVFHSWCCLPWCLWHYSSVVGDVHVVAQLLVTLSGVL